MMKTLFYFILISITTWVDASTLAPNETSASHYTVITDNVNQITPLTNHQIEQFYQVKTPDQLNAVIHFFEQQNIPYLPVGAMGEGDCDGKVPCLQIQQDPVYRLDGMDCVTLTQFFLSLLISSHLEEFKTNIIHISYGAADDSTTVSYLNRNHFISSDFNIVNQKNGILSDITNQGYFKDRTAIIKRTINHAKWFAYQSQLDTIAEHIRLLPNNIDSANAIINLFSDNYGQDFPLKTIKLSYIPKALFVTKTGHDYMPNDDVIDKIATPSIVEFVRDDNQWLIHGTPIKEIIGSNILISHLGILYRKNFSQGEIIYQNITCDAHKRCQVAPVYCQQPHCQRTMMLAASSLYPKAYIYSYNADTHTYACTAAAEIPSGYRALKTMLNKPLTCNRVLSMPLGDYLTIKQYGDYINMKNSSLIGLHLEKINE